MRLIEDLIGRRKKGWLSPLLERVASSMSERRQLISLLVLGVASYSVISAFTSLHLWELILDMAGEHTDLLVYQSRGGMVLDGLIPYKDFYAESPPLIIYFFAIPQALGGSVFSYSFVFGLLSVATGAIVYLTLKEKNSSLAYVAGAFVMFSPATVITSSVLIQDEVIVTFFFLLPLLLLIRNLRNSSSASVILGVFTKIYSVFLAPIVLIDDEDWRARAKHLLIMIVIASLVVLPFAASDINAFLSFPDYYLDTWQSPSQMGISLWHFLHVAGFTMPHAVLMACMVVGVLFTYYICYTRRTNPVRAGFLLSLPFIFFFPKIHESYYMIPVVFMAIFGAREERFLWLGVVVFIGAFVSTSFSTPFGGGTPIVPTEGGVIVLPLVLTICVYSLLLYTAWRQIGLGDQPLLPENNS